MQARLKMTWTRFLLASGALIAMALLTAGCIIKPPWSVPEVGGAGHAAQQLHDISAEQPAE